MESFCGFLDEFTLHPYFCRGAFLYLAMLKLSSAGEAPGPPAER